MLSKERRKRNSDLGSILRDARETSGMTQKELADAIGVSYYTLISQLELGYVSIPPALWNPIATCVGLNPREFSLRCLVEYQPDVYDALFGKKSIAEIGSILGSIQAIDNADVKGRN